MELHTLILFIVRAFLISNSTFSSVHILVFLLKRGTTSFFLFSLTEADAILIVNISFTDFCVAGLFPLVKRQLSGYSASHLPSSYGELKFPLRCLCILQVGYIRIDGSVPSSERIQLVNKFQSDPETRVAVLSIQAAGQVQYLHTCRH